MRSLRSRALPLRHLARTTTVTLVAEELSRLNDAVRALVEAQPSIQIDLSALTPPPVFGPALLEIREGLTLLLLALRVQALWITAITATSAVLAGLAFGDRGELARSPGAGAAAEAQPLARMPEQFAREWDLGEIADDQVSGKVAQASQIADSAHKGVSAMLWLELVVCVSLDVAGVTSYFFEFGEVSDTVFAFVNAFVIELFFDWPAMALIGFWEEILPFTDIVPTATLAWILHVCGIRGWLLGRGRRSVAERSESGVRDSMPRPLRLFLAPLSSNALEFRGRDQARDWEYDLRDDGT